MRVPSPRGVLGSCIIYAASSFPSASEDPHRRVTMPPPSQPGSGRLFLSSSPASSASFSALSGTYPLKLLAPTPLPSQPPNLRVCYMLAYGGGLVAGDTISLQVRVGADSRLVLLTQGSTKVFKNRMGIRPLAHGSAENGRGGKPGDVVTKQRLLVDLAPGSLLLLLPDPIQPFKSSSYIQSQRFVLPPLADGIAPASILILDWFTSGRNAGQRFQEEWEFDLYSSTNEVIYSSLTHPINESNTDDKTYKVLPTTMPIMREKTTLRSNDSSSTTVPTLRTRMRPYQTYATLLLSGPLLLPLHAHLSARANHPSESQFQASRPAELIWSFSSVEKVAEAGLGMQAGANSGAGAAPAGILRVAGMETEEVKRWIEGVLVVGQVRNLVGDAMWARIF